MASRTRQKLRTRRALLEAARQMIREGLSPSVPEVAERALVSRATAYRYFPSRDAILEEVELDLQSPNEESVFGGDVPDSAEERVSRVRAAFHDFSVRHEAAYRVFLRNWHDRWLRHDATKPRVTRGARRAVVLEKALEPLAAEVEPRDLERLKIALSVLIGMESVLVLEDILGLDRDEGEEAMDWAARTLIDASRSQAGGG